MSDIELPFRVGDKVVRTMESSKAYGNSKAQALLLRECLYEVKAVYPNTRFIALTTVKAWEERFTGLAFAQPWANFELAVPRPVPPPPTLEETYEEEDQDRFDLDL